ncbi:M1 family metallopeptidase [uncultured Croceitalea sp.]|uniref:M1 family metallopeptidase n=1 Tax=uncultured Croceitalea sp. TaxID=1798908 RepID=UPI0033059DE3
MRLIQFTFLIFFTSTLFAQEQAAVDFTKISMEITPIFDSKEIWGSGTYNFELKAKTDSIFIDAVNMTFLYVSLDRKQIEYSNSGSNLAFKAPEKLGNHELFIRYVAKPKQTVYFIKRKSDVGSQQIWTQGQGKYTSRWLPSFDDMTEKVEFDLTLNADEEYTVIANGNLTKKFTEDGLTNWHFDMTKPMSSYLAAFVIGDFAKKELTASSGVPLELYYEPKDSLKVEPTYRYTKEIFDFLEQEIGVPYPWQNYKQVPVQDFLYAGMENTGTTIFSNTYMIDATAFVDKNYVNVNAHELAHQWFGNLVTEENGKHHWLHEGFATYYAYLTEKELFGEEHFYWKLYDTAKTLHNLSENGGGEALTNPNANSLTFYEKGAWALVLLRERVGDKAFRKGIKKYLEKHQFKNVTISDFLVGIEAASNQNLDDFREKWLESEVFPWVEVKEKLKKESKSLALVFEMEEEFRRIKSDDIDYEAYWNRTNSNYFKQYLINKHHRILPITLINQAFLSKDIKVRQALATSLYSISAPRKSTIELTSKFETLLNDTSYTTIENTLIKLWSTFPEKRQAYLSKTGHIIGFPNKNVRLLWLTLVLLTEDYRPDKKQDYYLELNSYTSPENHFEVRQLAFQYLSQINAMSDKSLFNLINATEHHVWQFKKSSRNLLRKLSESKTLKERLLSISESLNMEQRKALEKIITK